MKRTELRRTTPLHCGASLLRGSGLNRVSAKRAKQNRVRVVAEAALGRDGLYGRCARCCDWTYVNGHERRPRSQGGDPARPDCLLCVPCNSWVADSPRVACWTGWYVSPKWPHDPALENGWARDLAGCIVIFRGSGRMSTMTSYCHSAQRRVARKPHSCQWGDCRFGRIQPGDVYLETKTFPGHDSGHADHRGAPVRMALCARCADHYGYQHLLDPIPYEQCCRDGLL